MDISRKAPPAPIEDADEPLVDTPANGCFHLPALVDALEPEEPDTTFTRTQCYRHDGWTPAKQRAFLERFAECGVISLACREVGLSARSAYNLRDRDPLFAAGWDAAIVKARPRLADEVFSRSMTGVVERIYKDGEIVAERHRHDNRLAMAVLARLDARADKAEAAGDPSLDLAANWDCFLDALGNGRTDEVAALLGGASDTAETEDVDSARDRELHELRQSEEAKAKAEFEAMHTVWVSDLGVSWTNLPPPPGFTGKQIGCYGTFNYKRHLTDEEAAEMARRAAAADARLEARRRAWLGLPPAAD